MVEARLGARDLIDRYSDAVTRRDFDCVAMLFSETAIWKVGEPFNMQFNGAAIGPSLGAAVAPFAMFMQAAFNSVIDVMDGTHATARTLICEIGKNAGASFVQFGVYEDSMAKIGGKWRFTARTFHPIYRDESELSGTCFPFLIGAAT